MLRFLKAGTILACMCSLASFAGAQTKLDTVIVNGSRIGQTLTEIGSSVSVLTQEDIQRFGADNLGDILANVPSVTVNTNGGFGGVSTVRIRGASSAQTLVLVDGIAVNDPTSPGGGFDLARFDPENIAQIEVLRGAQSTLWGSDAIGGVVSITTKASDVKLGGTAFAEYGSYDSQRLGASLGNATELGMFRLSVAQQSSNGISKADSENGNTEDDGFETLSLSGNFGANIGPRTKVKGNLLWSSGETEYDVFDFSAQGSVADGAALNETEEISGNISLSEVSEGGKFENFIQIGFANIDRQDYANSVPSFSAQGSRKQYRYQGTWTPNDTHKLAFGAEREETKSGDEDNAANAIFGLLEWKPVSTLSLTGGARLDDSKTYGSVTTGRFAAAYNPNTALTLRASLGQGFKAPTLFQKTFFCCGATGPNADIDAETSTSFDVGLDWRVLDERLETSITYFNQDIENQIDFSFADGGYTNIARVKSQGIEANAAYQATDWLNIAGTYAYIEADDGAGVRSIRLPRHTADVSVSIAPDSSPFSCTLLMRHNGSELNSNRTTLKSWTRFDLTGAYEFNDAYEVFGRIENVFDETYQQVLGYGTPDRSAYVGVRLRY